MRISPIAAQRQQPDMNSFKSTALSLLLVALILPHYLDWTEAQKTIANSFQQQQISESSGNAPNSVYGGYQTSSASSFNRRTPLVAPVGQRASSYVSRKQTEVIRQQPVYQQQQQQQISSSSYESSQQAEADAEPPSYGSVNGVPGQDFPNYSRVPKTSFSCDGLPYDYGMYADEETGCQAYHLCYNGRKDSFLCGPGTVFNQRILHCDYWYSVDCGKSSQYYSSNAYMGSSQPEPGPAQASSSFKRTEVSSSSYNRPVVNNFQRAQSSSFRNTQQVQEAY